MSMSMASSTPSASISMSMSSGAHSSMSMAMSSSTSSSSSAGSMDMSGNGDSMSMNMNTYLTTEYSGYPVVFKTLTASSGGAAFGIFCILFFTAFAFRGLGFLSAYIEQRVFQKVKNFNMNNDDGFVHQHQSMTGTHKHDVQESGRSSDAESELPKNTTNHDLQKNRSTLAKFFAVTPTSLYRDFIRVIIAFISAMLGYALMLAAMTFIIPYFFAIILGLSFGEVFFHRLASVMEINTNNSICESLH